MTLPTISSLEALVPELSRLANCPKSEQKQIDNFSTLIQTAARLWIIERSLYSLESDFFIEIEEEWFDCITWMRKFENKIPNLRKRTFEYFLLGQYSSFQKNQWKKLIIERYRIDSVLLNRILSSPLFSVVNKTLRNNFKRLTKLENSRLVKSKNIRGKYKKFLNNIQNKTKKISLNNSNQSLTIEDEFYDFFNEGLSVIAQLLSTKFHGRQRFFIQAEYVANENLQDLAADWADNLKEVWKQDIVVPIKIKYRSVSINLIDDYIIYPVAIHYYQRAYYLYAFGETPQSKKIKLFQWYSYRLDRIVKLDVLSWNFSATTKSIQSQIYQQNQENHLYTPNYIREQLELAYGFDFYRDVDIMLLRFDRDYHQRYIKDTIRHATFESIEDIEQVKKFIIQQLNLVNNFTGFKEQESLLKIVDSHSNDAYYKLRYRVGDNNVIMRLRSWGFNVEVLLPGRLRQKMKEDIQQTYNLY